MPVESVPLPTVPVDVGRARVGGPSNDTDGSEWMRPAQTRMDAPSVDWVGRSLDRPGPIPSNRLASTRCEGYGFDQFYDTDYDLDLRPQNTLLCIMHSIKSESKTTQFKNIRINLLHSMRYSQKFTKEKNYDYQYKQRHTLSGTTTEFPAPLILLAHSTPIDRPCADLNWKMPTTDDGNTAPMIDEEATPALGRRVREQSNGSQRPPLKKATNHKTKGTSGLNKITNFQPPPKIHRNETNYNSAVIKAEPGNTGDATDPIIVLEKYAEFANFLKDDDISENIEIADNGDIMISKLKPGKMNQHQHNNHNISSQDNSNNSKTPPKKETCQTTLSQADRRPLTMIVKWSFSTYPAASYILKGYSQCALDQNRSKQSHYTPRAVLNYVTIIQNKRNIFSTKVAFAYSTADTQWQNQLAEKILCAKYANTQPATIQNVKTYAVENAQAHTTLKTAPKLKAPNALPATMPDISGPIARLRTSNRFILITIIQHPNSKNWLTELELISIKNPISFILRPKFQIKLYLSPSRSVMGWIREGQTFDRPRPIPVYQCTSTSSTGYSPDQKHDNEYYLTLQIKKIMTIIGLLYNRHCGSSKNETTLSDYRQFTAHAARHNPRLEEARDCIYRLPPPGNTQRKAKQLQITDFINRLQINSNTTNTNKHDTTYESENITTHAETKYTLRILQWNACTMYAEKRYQLELLANEMHLDIICISELGRYRQINGFSKYIHCDKHTQSGIFWKSGLRAEIIETVFDKCHNRTQTQCILVKESLLLIHSYIAPDITYNTRKHYWNHMQNFIEDWTIKKPDLQIIITGDLNTRDKRFGINHSETHGYLDELLLTMDIISDKNIPTRGNNTLDITLANEEASKNLTTCKAIHKLNSDHCPTAIDISLKQNPYISSEGLTSYQTEYTVIDTQKTNKNLENAIEQTDFKPATLIDINNIIKNIICFKKIPHKPIKF